jgi:hypothetical protein
MNFFELLFAMITVSGLIVGTVLGVESHRFWGILLGVVAGFVGGFAIAYTLLFLIAIFFKLAIGGPLFKPRNPPSDHEKPKD